MSGGGLKPLSDEERLERESWREQQAWLAEQRDMEYRQRQAERAAEVDAIARHEAALAQAEENRLARLARQQRITAEVRERELADLRFQLTRHQAWQRDVDNAARRAVAVRQQQALLADVESHFISPPPPPEPEHIVYVSEDEGSPDLGDRDFNVKVWMQKPRPWW
jgi:hypothetical protein